MKLIWGLVRAVVFMVVVLIVMMAVGKKVGQAMGFENEFTALELAAAFLTGGIATLLYRNGVDDQREANRKEGRRA